MAADLTVTAAKVGIVFPESAEIVTVICGATITAGLALYFDTTAGTAKIADASAEGTAQFRGLALEGGAAGQAISMLKRGHVYGFTLTDQDYDDQIFLSDTDSGVLRDATGTVTVPAGRVVALPDSAMTKVVYIDADWATQWAA